MLTDTLSLSSLSDTLKTPDQHTPGCAARNISSASAASPPFTVLFRCLFVFFGEMEMISLMNLASQHHGQEASQWIWPRSQEERQTVLSHCTFINSTRLFSSLSLVIRLQQNKKGGQKTLFMKIRIRSWSFFLPPSWSSEASDVVTLLWLQPWSKGFTQEAPPPTAPPMHETLYGSIQRKQHGGVMQIWICCRCWCCRFFFSFFFNHKMEQALQQTVLQLYYICSTIWLSHICNTHPPSRLTNPAFRPSMQNM